MILFKYSHGCIAAIHSQSSAGVLKSVDYDGVQFAMQPFTFHNFPAHTQCWQYVWAAWVTPGICTSSLWAIQAAGLQLQ